MRKFITSCNRGLTYFALSGMNFRPVFQTKVRLRLQLGIALLVLGLFPLCFPAIAQGAGIGAFGSSYNASLRLQSLRRNQARQNPNPQMMSEPSTADYTDDPDNTDYSQVPQNENIDNGRSPTDQDDDDEFNDNRGDSDNYGYDGSDGSSKF